MSNRVILSADSTCDLGDALRKRYGVNYYPFHIILGERQYWDGVDITADEIYEIYRTEKILPKTAAISAGEYMEYFRPWTEKGYDVVHVNLGTALSAAYQNCCIAAKELGHVYPINSCSLSSGTGLLVIEAAERIAAGMSAEQVQAEVSALTGKCHASFVMNTLEFMRAGGRCSALVALGANLLSLKPCIEVDNTGGKMGVGKKYRGGLDKALAQYIRDQLEGRDDLKLDRLFITHSGTSEERINEAKKLVRSLAPFKEIFVTRASCTISSHCGPDTIGVLFLTK